MQSNHLFINFLHLNTRHHKRTDFVNAYREKNRHHTLNNRRPVTLWFSVKSVNTNLSTGSDFKHLASTPSDCTPGQKSVL